MLEIQQLRIQLAEQINQIVLEYNENSTILMNYRRKTEERNQGLLAQDDNLETFLKTKKDESDVVKQYTNTIFTDLRISLPETHSVTIPHQLSIEDANREIRKKMDEINKKYIRLNDLARELKQKREKWWKFW